MICWYCYWGWPKAIAEIFLKAKEALDRNEDLLLYGPGHIIWADENFDIGSAKFCLKYWSEWMGTIKDPDFAFPDVTLGQCFIVRDAIQQFADIIETLPDVEPDDYDGKHPENYPPLGEVIKIHGTN